MTRRPRRSTLRRVSAASGTSSREAYNTAAHGASAARSGNNFRAWWTSPHYNFRAREKRSEEEEKRGRRRNFFAGRREYNINPEKTTGRHRVFLRLFFSAAALLSPILTGSSLMLLSIFADTNSSSFGKSVFFLARSQRVVERKKNTGSLVATGLENGEDSPPEEYGTSSMSPAMPQGQEVRRLVPSRRSSPQQLALQPAVPSSSWSQVSTTSSNTPTGQGGGGTSVEKLLGEENLILVPNGLTAGGGTATEPPVPSTSGTSTQQTATTSSGAGAEEYRLLRRTDASSSSSSSGGLDRLDRLDTGLEFISNEHPLQHPEPEQETTAAAKEVTASGGIVYVGEPMIVGGPSSGGTLEDSGAVVGAPTAVVAPSRTSASSSPREHYLPVGQPQVVAPSSSSARQEEQDVVVEEDAVAAARESSIKVLFDTPKPVLSFAAPGVASVVRAFGDNNSATYFVENNNGFGRPSSTSSFLFAPGDAIRLLDALREPLLFQSEAEFEALLSSSNGAARYFEVVRGRENNIFEPTAAKLLTEGVRKLIIKPAPPPAVSALAAGASGGTSAMTTSSAGAKKSLSLKTQQGATDSFLDLAVDDVPENDVKNLLSQNLAALTYVAPNGSPDSFAEVNVTQEFEELSAPKSAFFGRPSVRVSNFFRVGAG